MFDSSKALTQKVSSKLYTFDEHWHIVEKKTKTKTDWSQKLKIKMNNYKKKLVDTRSKKIKTKNCKKEWARNVPS